MATNTKRNAKLKLMIHCCMGTKKVSNENMKTKLHQFSVIPLFLFNLFIAVPLFSIRRNKPAPSLSSTALIFITWADWTQLAEMGWGSPKLSVPGDQVSTVLSRAAPSPPCGLSVSSQLNSKGYLQACHLRCIANPVSNQRTIVDHCPVECLNSPNFPPKICIYVESVTHLAISNQQWQRQLSSLFTYHHVVGGIVWHWNSSDRGTRR